eukprot:scaffold4408_cov143-Isochrysis_galbana.AAC.1
MTTGTMLMSKGLNVRICSCKFEKEQYNIRKVRRTETKNLNVRDALRAPPPKPCQRFANGICRGVPSGANRDSRPPDNISGRVT